MVVTMAMLTPVDSQVTHLLLLRNMQLDPVSSQIHLEHNLPVVPSVQSLQEGEIPEMPDGRISKVQFPNGLHWLSSPWPVLQEIAGAKVSSKKGKNHLLKNVKADMKIT